MGGFLVFLIPHSQIYAALPTRFLMNKHDAGNVRAYVLSQICYIPPLNLIT